MPESWNLNLKNKYINLKNKYINIKNKYKNIKNKYINIKNNIKIKFLWSLPLWTSMSELIFKLRRYEIFVCLANNIHENCDNTWVNYFY